MSMSRSCNSLRSARRSRSSIFMGSTGPGSPRPAPQEGLPARITANLAANAHFAAFPAMRIRSSLYSSYAPLSTKHFPLSRLRVESCQEDTVPGVWPRTELDDVTAAIYRATTEHETWGLVLERIGRRLGASIAAV